MIMRESKYLDRSRRCVKAQYMLNCSILKCYGLGRVGVEGLGHTTKKEECDLRKGKHGKQAVNHLFDLCRIFLQKAEIG